MEESGVMLSPKRFKKNVRLTENSHLVGPWGKKVA